MKEFWSSFYRHFRIWAVVLGILFIAWVFVNDSSTEPFMALVAGVLIGFSVVRFTRCYNEFSAELPGKAVASLIIVVPFSIIGGSLFFYALREGRWPEPVWIAVSLGILFPRWRVQIQSEEK